MGTYLSTPILDKGEESGETLEGENYPLTWGVVDMQGWRKSMEDAHVAQTNIPVPPHLLSIDNNNNNNSIIRTSTNSNARIFGVFDGHGGPEVARFCQLYTVEVLTKQTTWKEETPVIADPNDPGSSPVGQALIHSFHALDRMIDDMNRRDELIALRSVKPPYSERRTTEIIPIPLLTQEPSRDYHTIEDVDTYQIEVDEEEKGPVTMEETSPIVKPTPKLEEEETPIADDDSNAPVGMDEAANEDQDLMIHNGEEEMSQPAAAAAGNVTVMFQKILTLANGTNRGQLPFRVVHDDGPPSEASAKPTGSQPKFMASIFQNGRQICNLPDHAIHAGCTAIVAVLIGTTLTVANAGDSRAVLCRAGGTTEPLSFDHKPQQDKEMSRIHNAGGFVNQFGRVNGNLNLSRSIGDLKYKQVPGISPAEQMITAEPDIVQVTLNPQDEFIILGCDGIWDCLTNEQAVKYVRDRIDTKTPTQIGIEMLDEIISEDPRATQGIGGDNMTIMIIDLQPHQRSYR